MDPNGTYRLWTRAVARGNKYEANEHYENLRAWLERGGFEPDWTPGQRAVFFSYSVRSNPIKKEYGVFTWNVEGRYPREEAHYISPSMKRAQNWADRRNDKEAFQRQLVVRTISSVTSNPRHEHQYSVLKRYGDWAPTPFDPRGLALDEKQDWLVAPVLVTRDTPEWSVDASNYAVLSAELDDLDPGFEDHEEHRFRHWGPGWFEVILVKPGTKAAKVAVEAATALEEYPILDEEDWGRREFEAALEAWEDLGEDGEMPEYEVSDEGVRFRGIDY